MCRRSPLVWPECISFTGGIFIKMFFEKNTAKGGAQAFFTHTFLGKPKIMYYEIASKSELKPPYKTFFHEFGHAIDNLSKKGGRPFGNEAKELYEDICTELNSHCLAAASGTPVLPKDLFGGITNNQVGGGHRNEYWFNKRGKRINKISREAFAGYFEYRLTMPDLVARQAVINPYSCFTYTSQALEKMFCDLMG